MRWFGLRRLLLLSLLGLRSQIYPSPRHPASRSHQISPPGPGDLGNGEKMADPRVLFDSLIREREMAVWTNAGWCPNCPEDIGRHNLRMVRTLIIKLIMNPVMS